MYSFDLVSLSKKAWIFHKGSAVQIHQIGSRESEIAVWVEWAKALTDQMLPLSEEPIIVWKNNIDAVWDWYEVKVLCLEGSDPLVLCTLELYEGLVIVFIQNSNGFLNIRESQVQGIVQENGTELKDRYDLDDW